MVTDGTAGAQRTDMPQRMLAPPSAQVAFELRVERVYLALRCAETHATSDCDLGRELAHVEQLLRTLAARAPERQLAARLSLTADTLDFIWTAVAFDEDPRIAPLAAR